MIRKRWQEVFVVLFIIVPFFTLIWLPILTSDTKPWEVGDSIPVEPPSENRRIHCDAGFSIISPPNWTARNHNGTIHLTPNQVSAGRSKAGIFVSLLREIPHDLTELDKTTFHRSSAHWKVERRPSTFDDPALTTWTYFVQDSGKLFEVSYFIAEVHDEMPAMAMRYLETLKNPPMSSLQ